MKKDPRGFIRSISGLRISRTTKPALWATVGALLILAASQPTAYGLDFPMTIRVLLPTIESQNSKSLTVSSNPAQGSLASQIAEMAVVAGISQQVEMARSIDGAKMVAKQIMSSEYSWGDRQFTCINQLWTRESHWNYKAHNYNSGAHGIAQALPAIKMEVISDDWRTNPVTQIQWGLHYISLRYNTPCAALANFNRSRYY
jgi:hypothetical protein